MLSLGSVARPSPSPFLLWGALGLACSDPSIFVAWPPLRPETQTLIVGISRASGLEVLAYPAPGGVGPPPLEPSESADLGVELLELAPSLAALRLEPGTLAAASGGFAIDALDLVALSARRWSLRPTAQGGLDFAPAEVSALSAPLRSFRAQATPPPCPSPLRAPTFSLPEAQRTWLAFPLGEGQGVVGGDHGRLAFFDGESARELALVDTSTAGPFRGRFTSGGTLPDGRLWLAGDRGVALARLESDTVRVLRWLPPPPIEKYLFDGRARSEQEFYALGSAGEWLHFRDGAWTLLHHWQWVFAATNSASGAVFEAPFLSAVCAVHIADTTVMCHGARGLESWRVPTGEGSGLSVGGFVPGLGPVVGSTGGEFFRFDEAGFTPLAEGRRVRTRGFAPLGEGFLVGGDAGYLGYFDPARGLCEVSSGFGVVPDRITRLSDALYLLTGSPPGPETRDGTFVVLEWAAR